MRLDLRAEVDAELVAESVLSGLFHRWSEPAMLLHPLPEAIRLPEAFQVIDVTTEPELLRYAQADAEEFGDWALQLAIARTALGLPGCGLVMGVVDGLAVARSMTVVTGEMTGIHNVYVPPSKRGKGYGTAITAAAVEVARRRGAKAACLEATALGFPVYERMGFRTVGEYVVMGTEAAVRE